MPEERCNRQSRVQRKIEWALKNLDITDNFAYWNDDFLVLQDFDIRECPNYISGKLPINQQNNGWRECKRRTSQYLSLINKPINNYDLHVPLIFNKEKFLSLSEWWYKKEKETPLMRSLYGNCFIEDNIQPLRDIKLQDKWQSAINNIIRSKRWIISYGDGALANGFDKWMESYLPEKSIFEYNNGCNKCDKQTNKYSKEEKIHKNDALIRWKKLYARQ